MKKLWFAIAMMIFYSGVAFAITNYDTKLNRNTGKYVLNYEIIAQKNNQSRESEFDQDTPPKNNGFKSSLTPDQKEFMRQRLIDQERTSLPRGSNTDGLLR